MKKILLLTMVILLFAGCATVGRNFSLENVSELVLRETTKSDAKFLFGEPNSLTASSNNDGDIEVMNYVYASGSLASATARVLFLEFKENKLNAYVYNSGFKEDETIFNYDSKDNIVRNSSTKEDVLSIMGAPSGKALYPTSFKDYPEDHEDVSEVWTWSYTSPSDGLDTSTIKSQSVNVFFDDKGIVMELKANKEY